MGKKNRKKKKLKYSKSNFSGIVCSACQTCEFIDPSFCFNMYKQNPRGFMDGAYGKLRDSTYKVRPVKAMLEEIFCPICDNKRAGIGRIVTCRDYPKCLDNLTIQLKGINISRIQKVRKKKNKKKNKQRYVCQSYPTFFSGGNADWQDEIRRLLDGDSPIKPNRSEKRADAVEPGVAGESQNVKSETS